MKSLDIILQASMRTITALTIHKSQYHANVEISKTLLDERFRYSVA